MRILRRSGWDRYLWITQAQPPQLPDGGEVLRVSTVAPENGGLDPKRLGDLRASAATFLGHGDGGLVVLDCLDYLVLHNGPERVARALADVHDEISVHGGAFVVFVDASTANPRLVAWLAREFDPFPSLTPDGAHPEADGLPA